MNLSSHDILNYALTICALVLTFFIVWILYYVVKIFREMEHVIRDITKAIEKFNTVLDYTKEKISNVVSLIPMLVKAGEKIMSSYQSMKNRRASKKNKTKNKSSDDVETISL